MYYVSNAFSLQMQGDLYCLSRKVSLEVVKDFFELANVYPGVKSIIGHKDICDVINNQLGLVGNSKFLVNRETIKLEDGDTLYVAQYCGPRLPEGVTSLPKNADIKWYVVNAFIPKNYHF